MLVLTRKVGERIIIADSIVLEVVEIQGNRVRLGLQAPPNVSILREELLQADTPNTRSVEPDHLIPVT
jgi:carbon storage regulator